MVSWWNIQGFPRKWLYVDAKGSSLFLEQPQNAAERGWFQRDGESGDTTSFSNSVLSSPFPLPSPHTGGPGPQAALTPASTQKPSGASAPRTAP